MNKEPSRVCKVCGHTNKFSSSRGVPVTRRHFATLLATLAAWVSMRPKLHADAVNASSKPAIDRSRLPVYLWDELTLVEGPDPSKWGHAILGDSPATIVVPTFPPAGATYLGLGRTVFREDWAQRAGYPVGRHFNYVSGPKWWAPAFTLQPSVHAPGPRLGARAAG